MIWLLILTPLLVLLLAHLFHYSFHQSWSGRFYRAHSKHHTLYTPADFVSDIYRSPQGDSTIILFAILFAPCIGGVIAITVFGLIPLWTGIGMLIEMAIIGFANDRMHDSFHLTKSVWHRWPGYRKLRTLHEIHHQNTSTNYGIITFLWDRVFGTFRDTDIGTGNGNSSSTP